ncbi:hypothetical protein C8Q75DRAFT_46322 [Abortiporus biennis]|nr:hypothetical protein C8Q75DRAFT_46322 [Abortiporus biennis]
MTYSKRFHISVEDDDNLRNTGSQVIFMLTPVEEKGFRLYETASPLVWRVLDLRYGSSQICTLQCSSELGVCTAKKNSDGTVEPVFMRVVPDGQFTALTRTVAGHVAFNESRRWHQDFPSSIIVVNDSHTNQAFALCNISTREDEYEPNFVPFLLFNQIPHDKQLHVKTSLKLEAFYGSGFAPRRQLKSKDRDYLIPLLDENGKKWMKILNDEPMMSSFIVYKDKSGALCIRPDNVDNSKESLRGDINRMRERLDDVDAQLRKGLTDMTNLKALREKVEELAEETKKLRKLSKDSAAAAAGKENARPSAVSGGSWDVSQIEPKLAKLRDDCIAVSQQVSKLSQNFDQETGNIKKSIDEHTKLMRQLQEEVKDSTEITQTLETQMNAIGNMAVALEEKVKRVEGSAAQHAEKVRSSLAQQLRDMTSKLATKLEAADARVEFTAIKDEFKKTDATALEQRNDLEDLKRRTERVERMQEDIYESGGHL